MATPTNVSYLLPLGVLARLGVPAAPGQLPVITLAPVGATVTEPAAATFTWAATGAVTAILQRTPPGGGVFADIPGATVSPYSTGATDDAADNARQYRLRATNATGTVYSAVATLTVNPAAVALPSSSIVQYLTHDGDAVGNTVTSSAPNSLYWNTVLEVPWARGALGDWRDQAGAANGAVPYASFPAVAAIGRRTLSVTSLVQRWRANGLNRGFFLRARANAFPLVFAGRTAATAGDRPELVVVTTAGTFNIPARSNAHWFNSSVSVVSSAARFELRAGQGNAIVQFDLSGVIGVVTSATLGLTLTALTQAGAIVDVFEADPPALFDPAVPVGAVQGIGAGGDFNALRSHPDILFADDFATPGPFDSGLPRWSQAVTRTTDAARASVFATSFIATGALDSADTRIDIVNSLTAGGVTNPAQRRDSAHATIRFRMEPSFAGFADRVKIPAMGSQLGWWNAASGGYWQSTTGNGGSRGTGLKVINAGQGNRVEYEGHSSRLTTGHRCSDVSAYSDYVRLATYIYHLDQVGGFPTEDTIPGLVLKRGTFYNMSHYLALNSMSGAQDGLGNYATANADGVYRLWINGQQVLNRTNYRWRRHAEFCVQGFWVDVYHGGVTPSDRDMYYSVGELAIASSYIGPVVPAAPALQLSGTTWTPNLDGANKVLPTDFPQLPLNTWVRASTNTISSLVSGAYLTYLGGGNGLQKTIDAWGGAFYDHVTQTIYSTGGGHADSHPSDNMISALSTETMRFSVFAPRSAMASARWAVAPNTYTDAPFTVGALPGVHPGGNDCPDKEGRAPSIHTYAGLVFATAAESNTAAGVLHSYALTQTTWDIATKTQDTAHFRHGSSPLPLNSGDFLALMAYPYVLIPMDSFSGRLFDLSQREVTSYSANPEGVSLPQPTSRGKFLTFGGSEKFSLPGINFLTARKLVADDQKNRVCYLIGIESTNGPIKCYRVAYGAAIAQAVANGSWADFGSHITTCALTGAAAADFTSFAFNWDGTGPLYSAGADYDQAAGCLWVVSNRLNGPTYRIDGVSTSSWAVSYVPGAANLSTDNLGQYGRTRLARLGPPGNERSVLVRISSVTNGPDVMRVT